jgi:AcrR family transcriptional regulator
VAIQLGFRRQAVYHYFPSKDDILYELVGRAGQSIATLGAIRAGRGDTLCGETCGRRAQPYRQLLTTSTSSAYSSANFSSSTARGRSAS